MESDNRNGALWPQLGFKILWVKLLIRRTESVSSHRAAQTEEKKLTRSIDSELKWLKIYIKDKATAQNIRHLEHIQRFLCAWRRTISSQTVDDISSTEDLIESLTSAANESLGLNKDERPKDPDPTSFNDEYYLGILIGILKLARYDMLRSRAGPFPLNNYCPIDNAREEIKAVRECQSYILDELKDLVNAKMLWELGNTARKVVEIMASIIKFGELILDLESGKSPIMDNGKYESLSQFDDGLEILRNTFPWHQQPAKSGNPKFINLRLESVEDKKLWHKLCGKRVKKYNPRFTLENDIVTISDIALMYGMPGNLARSLIASGADCRIALELPSPNSLQKEFNKRIKELASIAGDADEEFTTGSAKTRSFEEAELNQKKAADVKYDRPLQDMETNVCLHHLKVMHTERTVLELKKVISNVGNFYKGGAKDLEFFAKQNGIAHLIGFVNMPTPSDNTMAIAPCDLEYMAALSFGQCIAHKVDKYDKEIRHGGAKALIGLLQRHYKAHNHGLQMSPWTLKNPEATTSTNSDSCWRFSSSSNSASICNSSSQCSEWSGPVCIAWTLEQLAKESEKRSMHIVHDCDGVPAIKDLLVDTDKTASSQAIALIIVLVKSLGSKASDYVIDSLLSEMKGKDEKRLSPTKDALTKLLKVNSPHKKEVNEAIWLSVDKIVGNLKALGPGWEYKIESNSKVIFELSKNKDFKPILSRPAVLSTLRNVKDNTKVGFYANSALENIKK